MYNMFCIWLKLYRYVELKEPLNGNNAAITEITEGVSLYMNNFEDFKGYRIEGSNFSQCNTKAPLRDSPTSRVFEKRPGWAKIKMCGKYVQ